MLVDNGDHKKSLRRFILIASIVCSIVINLKGLNFSYPASASDSLPAFQVHPLPASLAEWSNVDKRDNYFKNIKTTPVGYLIWSKFPISVYVESPRLIDDSASSVRFQQWFEAVETAIAEWNIYLPLQQISILEEADIVITRSIVNREVKLDPQTGLYDIPRTITAQTSYQFYVNQATQTLSHKMMLQISPNLGNNATLGAARHELGHALGIWGHSDRESDALYFSQVRDTPSISTRDISTLKQIYQQPTRLGWKLM